MFRMFPFLLSKLLFELKKKIVKKKIYILKIKYTLVCPLVVGGPKRPLSSRIGRAGSGCTTRLLKV